jgi:hypothetical protein
MRNPEDELPTVVVKCPRCEGRRELYYPSNVDEDFEGGWFACFTCHGLGEVEEDEVEAREDAREAAWHGRREEVGRG